MDTFPMCPQCQAEYARDPRRKHAQTIACPHCGPVLCMGEHTGEEAYQDAVRCIREGKLVAIKGIGGYQIVVKPDLQDAVRQLRECKGREKKPFAVMFAGVDQIRQYVPVSSEEEELLTSAARPIVLIEGKVFSEEVDGCSPDVGGISALFSVASSARRGVGSADCDQRESFFQPDCLGYQHGKASGSSDPGS